ncbi:MAG: sortase [Bacilli bacterium]|nr:sortase [Bacilli bacterium]
MKKTKKIIIIFLLSLFFLISLYIGITEYKMYEKKQKENEIIDQFLEEQKIVQNDTNEEIKQEETKEIEPEYDYIAVLEIPAIDLRKGIVDINSAYNDISYNVEIINPSDMPDIPNTNLILASHSGSSRVSFFKHLNRLNKGDLAIIYYKNVKYTYEVNSIENEEKNGTITIRRSNNKNTLTLTTCSPTDKTKQIVIICNLIRADKL